MKDFDSVDVARIDVAQESQHRATSPHRPSEIRAPDPDVVDKEKGAVLSKGSDAPDADAAGGTHISTSGTQADPWQEALKEFRQSGRSGSGQILGSDDSPIPNHFTGISDPAYHQLIHLHGSEAKLEMEIHSSSSFHVDGVPGCLITDQGHSDLDHTLWDPPEEVPPLRTGEDPEIRTGNGDLCIRKDGPIGL